MSAAELAGLAGIVGLAAACCLAAALGLALGWFHRGQP